MKAWIRVSVADKESDGRRRVMFLRWKKAVLVIYVFLKREVVVKNDSEVETVWGGREGGVVYGEAEVVSGFDELFEANDDYV